MKSFFTDDTINEYINYKIGDSIPVKESLGDFELLNYYQFMLWWNDYPQHLATDKKRIDNIFKDILIESCLLNEDYLERAIRSILTLDSFDVLFAVYKKNEIRLSDYNNDVYNYQTKKSERVGGFIIVELGECKKRPNIASRIISNISTVLRPYDQKENTVLNSNINYSNVYSVFLICCRRRYGKDSIPIFKCQLLLGAYLYIIKSNSLFPQIGILELAGGYTNISGFITYSKLGFVKNLQLYGNNCFLSIDTLPMSNDLSKKSKEDIIQSVSNDVALIVPVEVRELLYFYQKTQNNEKEQEELALLYNILYKLEMAPDEVLKKVRMADDFTSEQLEEYLLYDEENSLLFDIVYNDDGTMRCETAESMKTYVMKKIQEKLNLYPIAKKRNNESLEYRPTKQPKIGGKLLDISIINPTSYRRFLSRKIKLLSKYSKVTHVKTNKRKKPRNKTMKVRK
jgi:hypothetical protein